ncbi:MAG TPA: VWA domain-containing protein [Aggregatilineales bacterium]|nr:VWA domain-containing protein [Aggregatilineales bacterium]
MQPAVSAPQPNGHLLANLLHFGRLLRRIGLRVSTREVYDLAEGLTYIDITRGGDFYHAARAFLVHDPEEIELFDKAFELFWAGRIELMLELGLARAPHADQPALDELQQSEQRILGGAGEDEPGADAEDEGQPDPQTLGSYSPTELLRRKDFASFTEAEFEIARRFIRSLVWRLDRRLTRRYVRGAKRAARLDLRRAIRDSMQQGGEIVRLRWRRRKLKPRPLVVICDVSGSMERYSRLFLHFMYALVQEGRQVEAFVFGTRLTRITPALRHSDVDAALAGTADLVVDWSGGTRIGESLRAFNYLWARRVLGRGTVAIVISDGWDRGDIATLEREIARLHRSVSRLIWLNPLAGSEGYEPLVRGIRAALPHVDDFLPFQSLADLEDLALRVGTLSASPRRGVLPGDLGR